MLRDGLSNRWFQFGLVFFVLVVGGGLLYSWRALRTTESEMERHDRFLQERDKQNETRPAETVNVPTENETSGLVSTPDKNSDTPMSEEVEALPKETENLDFTEAFSPDDMVSEEDPTEDVPVSPYGFGPYPELPEGWPSDIWPRGSADHELMLRVQIKLISQGINAFGAIMEDGLIYPTIDNTIYIRWDEEAGDRYISEMAGDPDACDRLEGIIEMRGDDFTEADIPSDIKIVPYEDGGINPYTFLNLP